MKQTRYPIYILSKGRWESRLTSKTFEEMGADYRIVIEQQEYDKYAAVIDPKKILVLPFSNMGLGGIPARNWIWEHSISEGHKRHWVCDDNFRYIYRSIHNTKLRVNSIVPFRVCEDLTDRYENVPMSGLNYHFFQPTFVKKEPLYINTRVYSCILLSNETSKRWRVLEWDGNPAPYNEDTDLSLQFLEDGDCTLLLNHFSIGKADSGAVKGGNNDTVYKYNSTDYDNRYKFAASLAKAHPKFVEITQKHRRYHHLVDYSKFQNFNVLKLKPGVVIPKEPNNYGLKLVRLDDPKKITGTYTVLDTDNYLELVNE
jgi:hypothetical protein